MARHVNTLTTQLQKLDAEYDKCNEVLATGEVNGFNKTLSGRKVSFFCPHALSLSS